MRLFIQSLYLQQPLEDNPALLAKVAGVTSAKWKKVRQEMLEAGVLELVDGILHDRRARKAIDTFQRRSNQNRDNVARRYGGTGQLEDADE